MTVEVDMRDELRIQCDGSTLIIKGEDIIDMLRKSQKIPVLRPVSGQKSCPNENCAGGWAPDAMKDGTYKCPVCDERWEL